MKMTLELYGGTYSVEAKGDDFTADEMKEAFSRLLVSASYPPNVIELAEGGHFECEYKEDENV